MSAPNVAAAIAPVENGTPFLYQVKLISPKIPCVVFGVTLAYTPVAGPAVANAVNTFYNAPGQFAGPFKQLAGGPVSSTVGGSTKQGPVAGKGPSTEVNTP